MVGGVEFGSKGSMIKAGSVFVCVVLCCLCTVLPLTVPLCFTCSSGSSNWQRCGQP